MLHPLVYLQSSPNPPLGPPRSHRVKVVQARRGRRPCQTITAPYPFPLFTPGRQSSLDEEQGDVIGRMYDKKESVICRDSLETTRLSHLRILFNLRGGEISTLPAKRADLPDFRRNRYCQ